MSSTIAYLLASGLLDENDEPETDMEQLQQLMDAVTTKSTAVSTATNELRVALEQLRAAIDAILEGLS